MPVSRMFEEEEEDEVPFTLADPPVPEMFNLDASLASPSALSCVSPTPCVFSSKARIPGKGDEPTSTPGKA